MPNHQHLENLKAGVTVFNAWRESNPDVIPDLDNSDLSNHDLKGINLSQAMLSRCRLEKANLSGADFRQANLMQANLRNADCNQSNFSEANLNHCNLRGTDLSFADLRHTNLSGSNYYYAKLEGAKLSKKKSGPRSRSKKGVATTSSRFMNFMLDILLLRLIDVQILRQFGETELIQSMFSHPVSAYLFSASIVFSYYVIFELIFQKTPAKLITRTKVVMDDGSRPGIVAIVFRTIVRFIPFEAFSGSSAMWWHDRWTGTQVVKG